MMVLFILLYCWNDHQVTNVLLNWSTAHVFTRYCNRIVNIDLDTVRYCDMVEFFTLIRCGKLGH